MMLLAVNNSWVHSHTTIFPDYEYFPICTYILIPLTQFGYFHPSLMFLQKSIWICSLQCHITIKRFPHQRQNLKLFFFNISFFIGFDLGWKDGRDAHIDDHPVADNEDFPVFPQLRAIWLPKQCNVTAGSTSWLNSKFLPNNLRTTGVIANPAPRQFKIQGSFQVFFSMR